MINRITIIVPILLLGVLGFSGNALAGHGKGGLEKCLKTVSKIKPGDFVKVEYLSFTDEGVPAYEVEVRDADGNEWEFECSAKDARILEMEREVDSAEDPLFNKSMKVSEADAKKTATDLYPGTVKEVEYEIEANGDPSYEFDIVDSDGTEWKIEVSAVTGKIVEVQVEEWEIGEEDQLN
ncbi:putative membrane protein YkoI [Methylohalomonas lacus]|uniref:Membrane protein YkoI n=1 Tax=Methylohalomonas lacus TaxID=398773 RepID=A0AAE3HJR9_9GAMM|nr:PepSY domain-containing protein [Methylohalomonas lacus]MCS3903636.1 putative membrane protein YkoI [Methylohalomonas lacus]